MTVRYESARAYISDSKSLKEKITKIDQVIMALYEAAEGAAENQGISSYSLDDGQTSISTSYRTVEEAISAAERMERLKERYQVKLQNEMSGRRVRLLPSENFVRRW